MRQIWKLEFVSETNSITGQDEEVHAAGEGILVGLRGMGRKKWVALVWA